MRRFAFAIIAASLIAMPATAKPCRDAKGHFTKCSPMKVMPKKVCRDAKGHFKKC